MNLCFGLGITTRRSRVTIDGIDVAIGGPSCEVDSARPQILVGLRDTLVEIEYAPETIVTQTNVNTEVLI